VPAALRNSRARLPAAHRERRPSEGKPRGLEGGGWGEVIGLDVRSVINILKGSIVRCGERRCVWHCDWDLFMCGVEYLQSIINATATDRSFEDPDQTIPEVLHCIRSDSMSWIGNLIQIKWMKMVSNMDDKVIHAFQQCGIFQWMEVMNAKMQMIWFEALLHVIQIKLTLCLCHNEISQVCETETGPIETERSSPRPWGRLRREMKICDLDRDRGLQKSARPWSGCFRKRWIVWVDRELSFYRTAPRETENLSSVVGLRAAIRCNTSKI
jgi:hypothetical protein